MSEAVNNDYTLTVANNSIKKYCFTEVLAVYDYGITKHIDTTPNLYYDPNSPDLITLNPGQSISITLHNLMSFLKEQQSLGQLTRICFKSYYEEYAVVTVKCTGNAERYDSLFYGIGIYLSADNVPKEIIVNIHEFGTLL